MAWQDIHTAEKEGITLVLSKSFFNGNAAYTIKLGTVKKGPNGPYLSPFLPGPVSDTMVGKLSHTISDLIFEAGQRLKADKEADSKLEADRVNALSAKPGAHLNKDKFAPRATGKTAKKREKLAARAQAKA